jgi:hypothetical protein
MHQRTAARRADRLCVSLLASKTELDACASTAELVVRELEKDAVQSATEQAEKDDMQTGPVTRYMMRSVACFQQQGVAFVDTQLGPAWQALHCNLALSNVSAVIGPVQTSCAYTLPYAASLMQSCSSVLICATFCVTQLLAACTGDWRQLRCSGVVPLLGAVPAPLRAGQRAVAGDDGCCGAGGRVCHPRLHAP